MRQLPLVSKKKPPALIQARRLLSFTKTSVLLDWFVSDLQVVLVERGIAVD
jgi:hypothetical protein